MNLLTDRGRSSRIFLMVVREGRPLGLLLRIFLSRFAAKTSSFWAHLFLLADCLGFGLLLQTGYGITPSRTRLGGICYRSITLI